METLRVLRAKAALDIVIHTQVALNHICEISDNFIRIFVQKTLKLAHLLVVIEILLILRVQLDEDGLEVLERFDKLLGASLLGQVGSLLQLSILLLKSVVKLRQFDFHIVLDIFLLISHDLENLIFEFLFTLNLQFFEFVQH